MTRRVNGFLLEKMLRNGLANIRAAEETINGLNVFPVADGDTGLNMRLTLENGEALDVSRQYAGAIREKLKRLEKGEGRG